MSRLAWGQIAYEAYCASTGGKSAVLDVPLPPWDELSPRVCEAWMAAGEAVIKDYFKDMKPMTASPPMTIPNIVGERGPELWDPKAPLQENLERKSEAP